MAGFQPGLAANRFVQKIELRVSCENLQNKDVTSKSDPCAVLYFKEGDIFNEYGRTENAKNDLDPDFVTPFNVDYHFEAVQKLRIRIYDIDNSSEKLSDDDFLGEIECTLAEIVSCSPYSKPLRKKKGDIIENSNIKVTATEIKDGNEMAIMRFRAKKLSNKDLFGKSDPFMELSVPLPDGSWQVIHRTETVMNNLSPEWRPLELRTHTLCGGDPTRPIRFSVFDYDDDGSHDIIGSFTSTFDELRKSEDEMFFPCVNEVKKEKKKGYTDSGTVIMTSLQIKKEYSFLDFIFGGLQINLTFGVDFTGSNGDPREPYSLHYIGDLEQPNQYMQAIRAVGNVLQDYDADKLFPALGFGGAVPPNWETLFEFALNYNPQNPFCAGIQGVLDAYVNCIRTVQLSAPTNVAPIINHVTRFAADAQRREMEGGGASAYYILLLLTDGVLSDFGEVKDAIVQASGLPMSIIIVGVGPADFDAMCELDGDDGVLKDRMGNPVKRDIVQFVPFRDFQLTNTSALASHVLAEVPRQVTGYFQMRDLQPKMAPGSST